MIRILGELCIWSEVRWGSLQRGNDDYKKKTAGPLNISYVHDQQARCGNSHVHLGGVLTSQRRKGLADEW